TRKQARLMLRRLRAFSFSPPKQFDDYYVKLLGRGLDVDDIAVYQGRVLKLETSPSKFSIVQET
ncbi:MAG TPA: hypothetical protein VF779_03095, partial [Pyrinomonadaceae bacterium]